MTLALTGHAVAPGIAIGRTHVVERNELEIGEYRIGPDDVENEVRRYRKALEACREQLEQLATHLESQVGAPAGEIIQTHILMLQDSSIREATERRIRKKLCNAEWALQSQLERILAEFRNIDDDYIRSRGEDVVQVVRLVQGKLSEETAGRSLENIPHRLAETLVIASELTPGELAILHERGVAGVVTEHGSPYSHTAILASSLEIPAVMGVRLAQNLLTEGESLVLDGGLGVVYADPDEAILEHYHQLQRDSDRFRQTLLEVRDLPSRSIDGVTVSLQINGERTKELRQVSELGAEGVGLFRTEFLYLRGEAPDEESQVAHYLKALKILDGKPLTIRTMDLGADKTTDALDFSMLRSTPNPALGLRAIRLCLRDTELFKTQLRAILRTSAEGPIRCLIPMLTSVSEVLMVRALLEEAREELRNRGQAFDEDLPLGGMIEVPAAALAMEEIGRHLDFLSVGTNDLLQYALAADRIDEQVAHLYDPQHPGIVRLLQMISSAAAALNVPVAVCGELAGDRRFTRLLLALGLREFSMNPGRLLEVKQVITKTHIPRARAALTQWLNASGDAERMPLLQALDRSQQAN